MATTSVSYALDIGVYRLGVKGQVLAETTAAWCRAAKGTRDPLEKFEPNGERGEGTITVGSDGTQFCCGRNIENLATRVADDLRQGHKVALGFEAPMWLPLEYESQAEMSLFEARFEAESGFRWYLQSGAAASLKAIVLGVLFREHLRSEMGGDLPPLSTNRRADRGTLVLFEAFVAGDYKVCGKGCPDEVDALIAALAWGNRAWGFELPSDIQGVTLHEGGRHEGHCRSLWEVIFGEDSVGDPPDCDIVALGKIGQG